ncbi:hypothetical protein BGZ94_010132 [Podila epigama]|nr:hypothetical protein BGZ94_010132 [Podila epigama]
MNDLDASFFTFAIGKRQLENNSDSTAVKDEALGTIITSNATVIAGVVVFAVGMLILFATIGYYLVKGRPWQQTREPTKNENILEKSVDDEVSFQHVHHTDSVHDHVHDHDHDQVEETELRTILVVPSGSKILPMLDQHSIQNDEHPKIESNAMVSPGNDITVPKVAHTLAMPASSMSQDQGQNQDNHLHNNNHHHHHHHHHHQQHHHQQHYVVDHSPSTARLEEPQGMSVFAFLKGNYQTGSHMPALTRTKARSSLKYKNKERSSTTPQPRQLTKSPLPAPAPTALAITSASAPASASVPVPVPALTNDIRLSCESDKSTAFTKAASGSNSSLLTYDSHSMGSLQRTAFSPIQPSRIRQDGASSSSSLRLDMKNTRSSSVMALFGSPRSSPNGSVADGASIQAIFCPSVKSSMSLVHTESTHDLATHSKSNESDNDLFQNNDTSSVSHPPSTSSSSSTPSPSSSFAPTPIDSQCSLTCTK